MRQLSDKHTRRFLRMLALELASTLKPMRQALDVLKEEAPSGECRRAAEILERRIGSIHRLAEDLRILHAQED
jgi:hypothetical protein